MTRDEQNPDDPGEPRDDGPAADRAAEGPVNEHRSARDPAAWRAAGINHAAAQTWRRWNFTPDQARRWRAAGITEALAAAQWNAAGVAPGTVGDWVSSAIGSAEAVHWHEFGFTLEQVREHKRQGRGPEDAFGIQHSVRHAGNLRYSGPTGGTIERFIKAGVPHEMLRSYIQAQWTDDEAVSWARAGITATDARSWQSLGVTAAEAGELSQGGSSVHEVIRTWWRAGIPFDEVADWLGAGLSADEAVRQRASGVTVDQAAAMRALRRGGAL